MVDAVGSQNKLQKILLAWDYFNLCEKAEQSGGIFEKLTPVPQTFPNVKAYKEVFEPLLLEECASQIMRGVEEGEVLMPHPCVVSTNELKDSFLYVRLVLQQDALSSFGDNDLVLLTKSNPEELSEQDAANELHALGYCEGHEAEQSIRVKFYLSEEAQAGDTKGTLRMRSMREGLLTKGSCWYILKLSNMSTITREWIALQHVHLCPFIDILLSDKPRALHESKHMDIPPGMQTTMENQCNASQMDALRAGLDGTPCVLIQGPPGTGKTRTILNLLSVVMHAAHKGALELRHSAAGPRQQMSSENRVRLWEAQAPWVRGEQNPRDLVQPSTAIDGGGNDCFGLLQRLPPVKLGRNSGPKAHVLVCAPSNSALDEIVLRILKSGLMDKDGNMFAPSIVRIGVNVHHSVRSVSIDAIVDSRLGVDQDSKALSRLERDRMRLAILDEASIVCSTLSFAGSSIFYRLTRKFDVVIIDEAAQAVEPSTLVPLVMGCRQVYLVGDPVQLPATVISTRAVEYNYEMSMFKRLQLGGYPVKILDTQYRMHPDISKFPSKEFYNGKLLDGQSVTVETVQPWHVHKCFGPFAFYDVPGKESIPPGGASIMNKAEAHMVLCIYRELVHRYPALRQTPSVAVISPYKAQVKLLRESFKAALGEEGARMVDINTIDGFQGREKDIVFFSCVRSLRKGKKGKGIGFVADERRINVGLTRARCSLIVIGNTRALQANGHWANLIHDAMTTSRMYRPKTPYADWMTSVAEGKVPAVTPTEQELAALDKARQELEQRHDEGAEDQLALELHEEEPDEGQLEDLQGAMDLHDIGDPEDTIAATQGVKGMAAATATTAPHAAAATAGGSGGSGVAGGTGGRGKTSGAAKQAGGKRKAVEEAATPAATTMATAAAAAAGKQQGKRQKKK